MKTKTPRHRRLVELLEPRQFLSTVTVASATAHEADGSIVFQVTLDTPAVEDVVVRYTARPDSALPRKDYRPIQGKVTIAAGETTGTIAVELKDDGRHEGTEEFKLNLTAKGATLASKTAVGTIKDDDAAVVGSVKDVVVKEGNGGTKVVRVVVSLAQPAEVPVTVAYETFDETPYFQAATAGDDYVASSGSITFKAGETKKSVLVTVKGDGVKEGDEVFLVKVTQPAGVPGGIGEAVGAVTIRDDDKAGKKGEPILKVADTIALEGQVGTTSQAGLMVTLSRAASENVTFRYSYGPKKTVGGLQVAPVLGAQTAKGSGKITIPAGQTTALIPVTVQGNGFYQLNQRLEVTVSKVKGARPINGQGSVSAGVDVMDDEPVLLTDFAGTLVLGISGVVHESDLYLMNQTVAGWEMPVIYARGSLIAHEVGGWARLNVAALALVGQNIYVMPELGAGAAATRLTLTGSTYYGDTNLNGSISANDYSLIDRSFGSGAVTAGTLNLSYTSLASDMTKSGSGKLTLLGGTNYGGGSGAASISAYAASGDISVYGALTSYVDAMGTRFMLSEAEVRSQVVAGMNGGAGIRPTLLLGNAGYKLGVGYAVEGDGRVLVKAAWFGDADLDGVVDEEDRAIVLGSMAGGAGASWGAGDFNYDGVIGADDLSLLDRNMGAGS